MNRTLTLCIFLLTSYGAHAVQVTLNVSPARCGLNNGRITSNVSGGLPPYTYSWSNGSTSATLNGLAPGEYTLTVTDGQGGTAEATGTIQAVWGLGQPSEQPQQAACAGSCSGHVLIYESNLGGTAPYNYSYWSVFQESPGVQRFTGLCPDEPTPYTVTDANGCSGSFTVYPNEFPDVRIPVLVSSTPSCGGTGGTILVDQPEQLHSYWVTNLEGTYDELHLSWETPGPHAITDLPPGNYTVQLWDPQNMQVGYCTGALNDVIIGSLSEPCGVLTGRVFHDADQNCAFDGGDVGLPYRLLTIEPGTQLAITSGTGEYQRALDPGAYTVQQSLIEAEQLCPTTDPVPFTIPAGGGTVTVDFADSSTVQHDVEVFVSTHVAARPGFPTRVSISLQNRSFYPSGELAIALDYDPLLQDPGLSTWSHPGLPAFGVAYFTFDALVPADIGLLGQELVYTATVTNTTFEQNTTNNTYSATRLITGSYDPNDKRGVASTSRSDDQFFIGADEWIDYTVRFQNTGTDTAFTVVIRDVIEEDLDIESLQMLAASHAFTPSIGDGRELVFTFSDILLPDSTTDLLGSQGFVAFRLKPHTGLLPGDVIENTASIFFDFNEAIITNTTEHAAEFSTEVRTTDPGEISLSPVPTADRLVITTNTPIHKFFVHTADGRIVLEGTASDTQHVLMFQDLPDGAYVLSALTTDGQRLTDRFIKQSTR
ncbi:MAG TPA: SprB repeat-containing protein [Flavobacteriales bacterium]|jgi:uncharacterized repeat protein (TIGR01451 family)|nr:SprB repeat-containing protein [Flavobacteriales bacterium]